MGKRLLQALAAPVVFLLLCSTPSVYAGVSGKISGVVEDAATEAPLIGATVRVVGLNVATTTDEDGEYFLIDVPVGEYDLSVTHVGFEVLIKKGVRVLVDLTTPVDFAIRQVAVNLDRQVVVTAANPVIQRDLTASRSIYTAERLGTLPNTVSIQSVLTNYPGVVIGKANEMHVRGGRSGQVTYYLDGFSVQDPFVANSGIRIMPSALEELSLISGGFAAQYGEALSGVVNAVTREGGSAYQGKIRYYEGLTRPYDVTTGDWKRLEFVDNRSASFNISGPIPGLDSRRYTFFAAGEYLRNNGSLPHNGQISYTGIAKLSMQPTSRLKLKANVTYYEADGERYDHRDVNGRSYDLNLDGLPSFKTDAYLIGISGNYALSERTILSARLNRFKTSTLAAPTHLMDLHWSEWPQYLDGTISEVNYNNEADYSDPLWLTGFTSGDDYEPTYSLREAKYNSLSTTMISQIAKSNEVKAGAEIRRYDVFRDFRQFYNTNPYVELYSSNPVYAAVYAQDKLEYKDFVVNMGLRLDYRNNDISYNTNPSVTPEVDPPVYKEADSKTRIAPRLGISFPITENSVMHFNYGIYYQVPIYQYMYFNLEGDLSSGLPIVGNPDLDPEQTTSFELGLDHLIGDDLRIDLTAYYKDITDLVTTRSSTRVGANNPVTYFDNGDYGSVKGYDIAIERLRLDGNFSATVSYSYMIATGNGSNALEPYYTYINDPNELQPVTEYPLDFDQRHTLTAMLDYRVPRDWSARVFGVPIPGAWGLTLVGYYGSGMPYTKTDAQGNRLGERNEGRLPANYSVDLRFNKDFHFGTRKYFMSFFLEVDNLFDRRNIINVYARTGLPDEDNYIVGAGLALDQQELDYLDYLYDHDPQNYSAPRTIRTGLEFNF